jgi:hypothetical protein
MGAMARLFFQVLGFNRTRLKMAEGISREFAVLRHLFFALSPNLGCCSVKHKAFRKELHAMTWRHDNAMSRQHQWASHDVLRNSVQCAVLRSRDQFDLFDPSIVCANNIAGHFFHFFTRVKPIEV